MRNPLKLRKNRSFEYSPRYYKGEGNPYKIEHKLDKFRSTVQTNRGIKNKFTSAMDDLKNEGDKNMKLRFLVIVAILVLLFLIIIDFDLSIFWTS
ncbi:riboflavin synthase subunit beta [Flagellimonas aequoris]|uniref:Riboflavin synthase subunit beta n=1 Tax=Flagellimonas aequoris TaxID=2306997 RepID=A0A418N5T0_9FLAO|nr:riboflavin synthase subunit beta [Allomuricauda aequoris]RIV69794.1 riboflavin synthase subunit beta [Allomuricauda aequoris]TXK01376.1 riboflavin synthase subunit beta [Allomuricauda aequoris]